MNLNFSRSRFRLLLKHSETPLAAERRQLKYGPVERHIAIRERRVLLARSRETRPVAKAVGLLKGRRGPPNKSRTASAGKCGTGGGQGRQGGHHGHGVFVLAGARLNWGRTLECDAVEDIET
jgi:hypothetical protein